MELTKCLVIATNLIAAYVFGFLTETFYLTSKKHGNANQVVRTK